MSDAIFPTLRGLSWEATKSPEFFSITSTSVSGLDVSATLSAFPRWNFSLSYEFLDDDGTEDGDIQQIVGFFLQRYGNVDDFLYLDPTDNTAIDQVIGVGDGVTKQFQLVRKYGGFIEPIYGVQGSPIIKVNGVATAVTINSKGLITFATAPAIGTTISWSGTFYYRVKFKESTTEFNNFMYNLWECKKIEFTSLKRVL